MLNLIIDFSDKVLGGKDIEFDEAVKLLDITSQKDIISLISYANIIRDYTKGSTIETCAIVNARSGRCPEDCQFCSQSVHYTAKIEKYPLLENEKIVERAGHAASIGAGAFGIVTSGRGVKNDSDLQKICEAVRAISGTVKIKECASLGVLTRETAVMLKKAGLKRYHHNLETAESFFTEICTTHPYKDRITTLKIAKEAGLEVCCGGIFGIGESPLQRIEFAYTLKNLEIDSIPMNFLNPIPGTPLEDQPPIHPMEILKLIAIYRFINPKTDIRICGGRGKNLRNTQALMYAAGANAVMIGDYLTVPGSNPDDDLQLIRDLMLEVKF
ncbi:MAG: biotin synthase BioB [Spirochaetes bacterium]|nr:biotin synthase BioB [Spirochaetota bacterium]